MLSNRPNSSTGQIEGLIVDNMGFRRISVSPDDILLFKELDLPEQLRQFLNSRGDMSSRKNAAMHLALLNNANGERALEWKLAKLPDIGSRLLELEAKLMPRKRISVGVIFGKKGQETEEEMFLNASSSKFSVFLSALGEKVTVGRDWPGWLGTFDSVNDEGQEFVYGSWLGFEICFHVAPYLDPQRQRQCIGNDSVLIFFGVQPKPQFRGQVNSVAFCVMPVKASDARASQLSEGSGRSPRVRRQLGDKLDGGAAPGSPSVRKHSAPAPTTGPSLSDAQALPGNVASTRKASLADSGRIAVPDLTVSSGGGGGAPSSPAPSAASSSSRRSTKKRKVMVRMSCFYRSRLESFTPSLPDFDMDLAKSKNTLRAYLFINIINAHFASLKSGPYAANTGKLYVAAISKIIEEEKKL